MCGPNGRCVNIDGGYFCECNEGWTGRKCQSGKNIFLYFHRFEIISFIS